jgi:DNA end-binding protein Ku
LTVRRRNYISIAGGDRESEEETPMARAIWTGQLVFGRVAIPVRLENVVEDKGVKAHLVHRKDKGRLHTKRICEKGGHEVPWEETARVVEVGNREVVDFEPDELKQLRLEREGEISLAGFTDPSAVDPVYFDRAYVVVPIGRQPRAFELLVSLMRQTGKVAVTRANLGGKSYPAILRLRGADIVVHTLHFGDEVRGARERSNPQLRPSARELDLATQLALHMTMPFDPTTTEDPYRRAVEEIAAGRKPRPIDEAAAQRKAMAEDAEVLDLMSALQQSLKQKPERGRHAAPRAARVASGHRGGASSRRKSTAHQAGGRSRSTRGHGGGGGRVPSGSKSGSE